MNIGDTVTLPPYAAMFEVVDLYDGDFLGLVGPVAFLCEKRAERDIIFAVPRSNVHEVGLAPVPTLWFDGDGK